MDTLKLFVKFFFFLHSFGEMKWLIKAGKHPNFLNLKDRNYFKNWLLVRNYENAAAAFDLSCADQCLFLLASN